MARRPRTSWLPFVVVAIAPLACGTTPYRDPCVPGGEAGSSYSVPLIERYTPTVKGARWESALANARYDSCGALDGLMDGQTLMVHIGAQRIPNSQGQTGCWTHIGDTPAPTSWTFGGPSTIGGTLGTDVTIISEMAHQGSCVGLWYLTLEQTSDAFAQPTPQGLPPMLVRRHFSTDNAESCPALAAAGKQGKLDCEDVWVSRLSR